MREEVERLEHHADLAADRVQRAQIVGQLRAVDDDVALLVLSSRLMQRIIVDLPEPDGPQITTLLLLRDRDRHVAQHVHRAVPLVHLVEHDRRRSAVGLRRRGVDHGGSVS